MEIGKIINGIVGIIIGGIAGYIMFAVIALVALVNHTSGDMVTLQLIGMVLAALTISYGVYIGLNWSFDI